MLRHKVTDNRTLSHFPCKRLAQSTWISQLSVIILPLKVDKVLTDRIFQMQLAQSQNIGSISFINLPINQTSAQLNFLPHTPHLQPPGAARGAHSGIGRYNRHCQLLSSQLHSYSNLTTNCHAIILMFQVSARQSWQSKQVWSPR